LGLSALTVPPLAFESYYPAQDTGGQWAAFSESNPLEIRNRPLETSRRPFAETHSRHCTGFQFKLKTKDFLGSFDKSQLIFFQTPR
jgi:hypothetical protein